MKNIGELLISGVHQVEVSMNSQEDVRADKWSASKVHRFLDGVRTPCIVVAQIRVSC